MARLAGKVALISGAGRGIGRAVALKLAAEGACVVLNDLDAEPAHETLEAIEKAGGRAATCIGNVTAADFPQRFVNTAFERFRGLDIIINNAGYAWDSVIQKTSDEQWYSMIDVHLTAPFRILRAAQPLIRQLSRAEQAAGHEVFRKVVNVSSVSGLSGNAGQTGYSTAKAGILGMTMTLAKEWGRMKVNVNSVAFACIETRLTLSTVAENASIQIEGRQIKVGINPELAKQLATSVPLGRFGTTEEAAGAIYLFCTPESNYISGQTIVCGGGASV